MQDTRELLREVLSEEGYRVMTSGSGEEALEIGKQEFFDVIISDMRLGPNLNGLDVLRAYKAIQPESEVILITAFGSMETAIEAVKAGAFDYISKPFKIDEVAPAGSAGAGESQTAARESQPEAATGQPGATLQPGGQQPEDAGDLQENRHGVGLALHRADLWRERDREGIGGEGDPLQRPARRAVLLRRELRGADRNPARDRTLRARARLLHRAPPRTSAESSRRRAAARFFWTKSAR